jgi:hypothetical protein
MKKRFGFISYIDREAFIWTAGLLYLAVFNFHISGFTICPIRLLGFGHCPGCGLGLSIHYLFRFSFIQSINAHPLGIIALPIIIFRIYSLQKMHILKLLNKYKLGAARE